MSSRSIDRNDTRGPARVPPAALPKSGRAAAAEARRSTFRRRRNRRVAVQRPAPVVLIADGVGALGRKLLVVLRVFGKAVLVLGLVAAVLWGGRLAVAHVLASPRFAVREVLVSPTLRVTEEELLERASVELGGSLLALDTDAIAARVAGHPWVRSARVERQLPSALRIEVTEREARATVTLGALYLVDEAGRPFKRATMDEADGLPVITGLEREQYVAHKQASEAAFREALAVLDAWRSSRRPEPSEIAVHPRFGFTVFLMEGGGEVRLGRGDYRKKLAQLDRIFEAVKASDADGIAAIRVVHLDGTNGRKVPVRLSERAAARTAETPAPDPTKTPTKTPKAN